MRNRLIELLTKAKKEYANDVTDLSEIRYVAECLLADGWIRPPCKVGQELYFINKDFNEVMEGYVRQFTVAEGIFIDCVIRGYFGQVFHSSKIGKAAFLTREEAEQALKRKEDEGK